MVKNRPGDSESPWLLKTKSSLEPDESLCFSSERVEKDRAIREKQEGRLLADLVKLETRIAKKRLAHLHAFDPRRKRLPRHANVLTHI